MRPTQRFPVTAPGLAALALLLVGVPAARADLLYSTGFEPPQFTAGQPIDGQGQWIARSSPAAGVITTSHPAAGLQSLQINGAALDLDPISGFYAGVYRPSDFPPTNIFYDFTRTPVVLVQASVRLDGPVTGSTLNDDLISANLNAYNHTTDLAEMWISSNGHVVIYSDAGGVVLGPAVSLGQYHTLAFVMDAETMTDSFFVDGAFAGSLPLPSTALTDPTFVFNDAMFGVPDFGTYAHGDYTGYFDNILVGL